MRAMQAYLVVLHVHKQEPRLKGRRLKEMLQTKEIEPEKDNKVEGEQQIVLVQHNQRVQWKNQL